jgi:hypothetical protein
MGAIIEEVDENWREREESLELAVLKVVKGDDRVKTTNFCIGKD